MQRNSQEIFDSLNAKTLPARNQEKSVLQAAQEKRDQQTLNEVYKEAKELFKKKFAELSEAANEERLDRSQQDALTAIAKSDIGFDVTEDDSVTTQRTILYWAVATYQPEDELLRLIKTGKRTKDKYTDQTYFLNGDGRTVFSAALELENETAVRVMLADNSKLATNNMHQSGNKPAHYLISAKKHSMLCVLLECAPNAALAVAGESTSPLHAAAKANDTKSAFIIIDAIPAPEKENDRNYLDFGDSDGNTALHFAAANGNKALVERLLQSGANPNLTTGRRHTTQHATPLQLAASNGQNEVVLEFMRNGVFETKANRIDRSRLSKKVIAAIELKDYIDGCSAALAKESPDGTPVYKGLLSQGMFHAAKKMVNNPEQYTLGDSIQRKMTAAKNQLDAITSGANDPWGEISEEDQRTLTNSSYYSKFFSSDSKTTDQIVAPLRDHNNSRSNSSSSSDDEELAGSHSPARYHY